MKLRILAFKWTLASGILILIALLLPSGSLPRLSSPFALDKLAHCVLFFLFAFAFGEEYTKARKTEPRLLEELAIIAPFILISELLQLLTSTRSFEWPDMGADALGALLALILRALLRGSRRA